jgi:hypothetical protein
MGKIDSGQMVAEGIEVIKIGTNLVLSCDRKPNQGNIRLSGGVSVGEHADELDLRATFVDCIDAA